MKQSEKAVLHLLLETHMREIGLQFAREHRFCPPRRWKLDYLITNCDAKLGAVAVEIEGGTGYHKNPKGEVIRGGRHNHEQGYEDDCVKYSTAAIMGYRVLRFTSRQVRFGEAREFLLRHVVISDA